MTREVGGHPPFSVITMSVGKKITIIWSNCDFDHLIFSKNLYFRKKK